MARQTETVSGQTILDDMRNGKDISVLVNGKFRRLLDAVEQGDGMVFVVPRGIHAFEVRKSEELTILHRDPRCKCGCSQATKGGLWFPGHDAKAHAAPSGPEIPNGPTARKWYRNGYLQALADIQTKLDEAGVEGVEEWIRNNG